MLSFEDIKVVTATPNPIEQRRELTEVKQNVNKTSLAMSTRIMQHGIAQQILRLANNKLTPLDALHPGHVPAAASPRERRLLRCWPGRRRRRLEGCAHLLQQRQKPSALEASLAAYGQDFFDDRHALFFDRHRQRLHDKVARPLLANSHGVGRASASHC